MSVLILQKRLCLGVSAALKGFLFRVRSGLIALTTLTLCFLTRSEAQTYKQPFTGTVTAAGVSSRGGWPNFGIFTTPIGGKISGTISLSEADFGKGMPIDGRGWLCVAGNAYSGSSSGGMTVSAASGSASQTGVVSALFNDCNYSISFSPQDGLFGAGVLAGAPGEVKALSIVYRAGCGIPGGGEPLIVGYQASDVGILPLKFPTTTTPGATCGVNIGVYANVSINGNEVGYALEANLGNIGTGQEPTPWQSPSCHRALEDTNQDEQAIARADQAWPILRSAAAAQGISPSLLAAIGVHESGFRNIEEKNPEHHLPGYGVFQITGNGVPPAQAEDPTFAANWAARYLAQNMTIIRNDWPNFTPRELLLATAASYNLGPNDFSGNPNTIDAGSKPDGKYGADVLELMACFVAP